jgi:RNA recognition motif-containing protein
MAGHLNTFCGASTIPSSIVAEAGSREPPKTAMHTEVMGSNAELGFRPTKLFIGGITRNTTTKHLRDHFSQYGRVLDCVAMRQTDGRSRGFGYVTLDSTAAADRCLREPQLIDNRIVDMKPAVPEDTTMSGHTSSKHMKQCFNNFVGCGSMGWSGPGFYESEEITPWWAKDEMPYAAGEHIHFPDCLDLLSFENTCLFQPVQMNPAVLSSLGEDQLLHAGKAATLSASASEFVPSTLPSHGEEMAPRSMLRDVTNEPTLSSKAKQIPIPATKASKATRKRAPLGEITNVPSVDKIVEAFKSSGKQAALHQGDFCAPKKPSGCENGFPIFEDVASPAKCAHRSGLLLDDIPSQGEESVRTSATLLAHQSADDDGTADDVSDHSMYRHKLTSANIENVSAGADVTPSDMDTATTVCEDTLPSIGSALHSIGECKRCNFFPRGRCQSGKNCTFCHFPHEKVKPTRQEKRERRAAWFDQNEQEAPFRNEQNVHRFLNNMDSNAVQQSMLAYPAKPVGVFHDEDECLDMNLAYSILPGLPPIRTAKLPAPLMLPGTTDMPLPPGLTPMWQPDSEPSPLGESMLLEAMPGLSPQASHQMVVSAPRTSALLSTSPSLASTPTAVLSTMPTTPQGLCSRKDDAVMPPAVSGDANEACRQYEQDVETEPAEGAFDRFEVNTCQWSRDILLHLRSQLGVSDGKANGLPLFRTMTISAQ